MRKHLICFASAIITIIRFSTDGLVILLDDEMTVVRMGQAASLTRLLRARHATVYHFHVH